MPLASFTFLRGDGSVRKHVGPRFSFAKYADIFEKQTPGLDKLVARDNQKMVLGNQQFEAGCPVGNQGYVNNFP